MLGETDALVTLAVKDLNNARKFYEGQLGFEPVGGGERGVAMYRSGGSKILVYKSEFAGTNRATAATWSVQDVDATVKNLQSKGIQFEHYDMPGGKREGDVHVFGKIRNAWFKDPDGNILSIVNG
ncbi:MAG TPA: VOC family protein [Thermoanaerobaculia bacterium]|nr:VOC family protein [Thermoanaerobaculia bacterium]